jgi:hypothetical protein
VVPPTTCLDGWWWEIGFHRRRNSSLYKNVIPSFQLPWAGFPAAIKSGMHSWQTVNGEKEEKINVDQERSKTGNARKWHQMMQL